MYSINLKGNLIDLSTPLVMGILNITPDSFYPGSRVQTEEAVSAGARRILSEGGSIIDVGAYSSRPNAGHISENEEMKRLSFALTIILKEHPDAFISIDTFRAGIAERCVKEFGAAVINDISGGEMDPKMFETIAGLQVPYILMHMQGTPQTMQQHTRYEHFIRDVFLYFSKKINRLQLLGVNDIIVDPGFGFSKNLEQNYTLMKYLNYFRIFDHPLLVGISRKSMIYKLSGTTPEESLNGTTVLNTVALMSGAHILRVHDVKEAAEAVKIVGCTTRECTVNSA
ncbi:MAG: dihydropteroate synthase [Candidatus Azobacteroides sp.]|nr:dihydropteroate synthase [Candidatus Azobacteroides sp.]